MAELEDLCWQYLDLEEEGGGNVRPTDKLVWHYELKGDFWVKSAYHLIRERRSQDGASSSRCDTGFWRKIWSMNVPPRIRPYAWRVCNNVLASRANIIRRLEHFDASCGFSIELDVHVLLECPLAVQIWECSKFQPAIWEPRHPSLLDCLSSIMRKVDWESLAEFVAVLWECWHARNKFIFQSPDHNPWCFSERKLRLFTAIVRLEEVRLGWECGIRRKQGKESIGLEVEEKTACLYTMQMPRAAGYGQVIMEGDCLVLIELLKKK
ncbi:hypothetical protein Cgig2_010216 [Carnegiea gigantea]|uniref:Reverse transcriptase zinc-binding domain-containing protein n=1 Tax=Carnegiea gigantea TaxID=171969 RepID=A0A9Q1JUF7_9CARY|nr:hypothetical protein Cgig2_010216 [Carnegiea gigantea]